MWKQVVIANLKYAIDLLSDGILYPSHPVECLVATLRAAVQQSESNLVSNQLIGLIARIRSMTDEEILSEKPQEIIDQLKSIAGSLL